jgi:predicted aspartyl protease
MTRLETPFATGGDLIIIEGFVTGPLGTTSGRFVLDTGAVMTTMSPELAELLGYSARDGIRRARVRTAIGAEDGYVLAVAEFAALRCPRPHFQVHVFDLGYDDIDGLLGLNFLGELNYEVRSVERRILVEAIDAAPAGRP